MRNYLKINTPKIAAIIIIFITSSLGFAQNTKTSLDSIDLKVKDGQYENAIEEYNIFIEHHPDFLEAYIKRGLTRLYIRDYDNAIQDFSYSINLKPDMAVLYFLRSKAKHETKDINGEIEDLGKAIQLEPSYEEAYENRGNIYLTELNKYVLAIEDYNSAISLKPKKAVLYYIRSLAKKMEGDLNGAEQDLAMVNKLDPDFISRNNISVTDKKSIRGTKKSKFAIIFIFTFIFVGIISSVIAATTNFYYQRKSIIELSQLEIRILQGQATFLDRVKIFILNLISTPLSIPNYVISIIISIVIYIII